MMEREGSALGKKPKELDLQTSGSDTGGDSDIEETLPNIYNSYNPSRTIQRTPRSTKKYRTSISTPIKNTSEISKLNFFAGFGRTKAEALKENLRTTLKHHGIAKMHFVTAREKGFVDVLLVATKPISEEITISEGLAITITNVDSLSQEQTEILRTSIV